MVESVLESFCSRPWDLRTLAVQDAMYAMEATKVLPGYKIVELVYELKRTLALLESYVSDIENHFDNFETVDELDHWFETESSLLTLRFDVSKAVFGAASTAYALREL